MQDISYMLELWNNPPEVEQLQILQTDNKSEENYPLKKGEEEQEKLCF